MTYKWVILALAVMIAGIVLWQLGIFSGGGNVDTKTNGSIAMKTTSSDTKTTSSDTKTRSSRGSANKATGFSTSKVGLLDASIKCSSNGSASFVLTNQAGTPLSDVIVTPTGSCTTNSIPVNLPPAGNAFASVSGCNPTIVGSRWTINTTTTFTENVAGENINRTQTGQIICTVESYSSDTKTTSSDTRTRSSRGSPNKATGFAIGKVGLVDASIKCSSNGSASFVLTNQAGIPLSDVIVSPTGSCTENSTPVNITLGDRVVVSIGGCTPTTVGSRWTISTNTTFTEDVAGVDINRRQLGQIICTVES